MISDLYYSLGFTLSHTEVNAIRKAIEMLVSKEKVWQCKSLILLLGVRYETPINREHITTLCERIPPPLVWIVYCMVMDDLMLSSRFCRDVSSRYHNQSTMALLSLTREKNKPGHWRQSMLLTLASCSYGSCVVAHPSKVIFDQNNGNAIPIPPIR